MRVHEVTRNLHRVCVSCRWSEVEDESGTQLVYKCGGLDLAKRGSHGEDKLRTSLHVMDNLHIPYHHSLQLLILLPVSPLLIA